MKRSWTPQRDRITSRHRGPSSQEQAGPNSAREANPSPQMQSAPPITRINRAHLHASYTAHVETTSNPGGYPSVQAPPEMFESVPYVVPRTSPLAQNVPTLQGQGQHQGTLPSAQLRGHGNMHSYPPPNSHTSRRRTRPRPLPYPAVAAYPPHQQNYPGLVNSHSSTGRSRVFDESEQPLRSPTLVTIPGVSMFDAALDIRDSEGDSSSDLDSPPGSRLEMTSQEGIPGGSSGAVVDHGDVTSSTEHVSPPRPHTLRRGISKTTAVLRRAGPYLLGPKLGASPVWSIVQCLARKEGTDNFYTLKDKAVAIKQYDVQSAQPSSSSRSIKKRLCLVLDCLVTHDFATQKSELINLQHHVIREKKLSEKEAVVIFRDVVKVVQSLHKKNIVHRDLKLGNMVLNKSNRKITLTNFCLGKHLISECDLLKDQRGSPAYISPDVLSGKPYLGKPSDMWALGVVLFTMLYGQFPFYDSAPQELFRKIKAAEFSIPNDGRVSETTISIIRNLLVLNPHTRKTASQVSEILDNTLSVWKSLALQGELLQVVPDIDDQKEPEPQKPKKNCPEVPQPGLVLPEWEPNI